MLYIVPFAGVLWRNLNFYVVHPFAILLLWIESFQRETMGKCVQQRLSEIFKYASSGRGWAVEVASFCQSSTFPLGHFELIRTNFHITRDARARSALTCSSHAICRALTPNEKHSYAISRAELFINLFSRESISFRAQFNYADSPRKSSAPTFLEF